MKKILTALLLTFFVFTVCACGCTNEAKTTEPSVEEGTIIPDIIESGSDIEIAVMNVVENYLNNFISCDFDKIKESLHEDDKWLFNFEDEEQMLFYEAIFPLVEYEFEYVAEHDGVYGVMTHMKSPDMADVYGTVLTEYLDSSMLNDTEALSTIVSNNTERMIELIKSDDISTREEVLFIYVEYIDSEYIPRCDMYLANELTGGAPEASEEISSTINETITSLTE